MVCFFFKQHTAYGVRLSYWSSDVCSSDLGFARLITLNLTAQQALIAAFDPLLRKSEDAHLVALTSSVAQNPRAYWGAYGASKAALETLVLAYGEEVRNISNIRTAIIEIGRAHV